MVPLEWQTYVSVFKDAVTAGAAITAAVVAVLGLRAWRKQLLGKTEYELARRYLRAVYQVRDSIRSLRNPVGSAEEISQAFKESAILPPTPGDSEYNFKLEQALYNFRWKRINDAFSDLDVEILEAEVSWSVDAASAIVPLRTCRRKLFTATRRHLNRLHPRQRLNAAEDEEIDRIIYDAYSDDPSLEDFTNEVKQAVEVVERFLKPHLKL